jgi:SAM-dependent methyltransferase
MEPDLYAMLADRYDLFPARFSARDPAYVDFFKRLFQERGVRSVLDCGCGTGRDLLMFMSLGTQAEGLDASEAMLAVARRNLRNHGVAVPLHRADFRELRPELHGGFDAVTCLSTSLGHVRNDAEALQALRSMRSALREGGVLVLDQGMTDGQYAARERFHLIEDTPQATRVFVLDYLEGRDVRFTILDVLRDHDRAEVKTWSAVLHMLLRDDQERLLREAGFKDVAFYGGFGREPYDDKSERLIAVAVR